MARESNLFQILRAIPPKWAFGVIALLLVYWLIQPTVNRTFGTQLPSLRSIVTGEEDPVPKPAPKPKTESQSKSEAVAKSNSTESKSQEKTSQKSSEKSTGRPTETTAEKSAEKSTDKPIETTSGKATVKEKSSGGKSVVEKTATGKQNAASKKSNSDSSEPKVTSNRDTIENGFGYLEQAGRNRFESPAGLIYAPGSEEGHRLKHLERHLSDQPNRPGSHGVFEGDMPQVLKWIDEAYSQAKKGGRGTKKYTDEDATVYEATLDRSVGYIGGSDGGRKGNPSTKRIRIVVRGSNVITAFPF